MFALVMDFVVPSKSRVYLHERLRHPADVILRAVKASVLCFFCFTTMIVHVLDFAVSLKSASLHPRAANSPC